MWIGIATSLWGQEYRINYKDSGRQTDIPERVDTVFIPKGMSRKLFVPELRINDGATPQYRWFVNWYRIDKDNNVMAIDNKFKSVATVVENSIEEGGNAADGTHKAALKDASYGGQTSLFWYFGLYNKSGKNLTSTATGASTVEYSMPNPINSNYEDFVICDVSAYIDGLEGSESLTEPTISKRYKFVIRNAEEIAQQIKNGYLEKYEIDAPANAEGVSVQMKTFPSNYCWKSGDSMLVGEYFSYTIDGKTTKLKKEKKVITIGKLTKDTEVEVRCVTLDGKISDIIAKFNIKVKKDVGFMLEDDPNFSSSTQRNPHKYEDLYLQIGSVDFDFYGTVSNLSVENNIAEEPPSPNSLETSYGFAYRSVNSLNYRLTPLQNHYGVYRSALHENVSKNDIKFEEWKYSKVENGTLISGPKRYLWIYNLYKEEGSPVNTTAIYDRTKNGGGEYGSFVYIDAANDPGLITKVDVDGAICNYTELVITAWVNDMTRANESDGQRPLPPNINLKLIGTDKDGNTEVLHRFTSGDAITDYTKGYNDKLAKWQQLCYTIVLNQENLDAYKKDNGGKIQLEVQNNARHSDGADYAIDDIRIYMSKPNIKVQRESTCEASTLVVSSDYGTLLRNMGWNIQPNVLEGVDLTNPHFRKYRYGLMGPDPYTDDPHNGVGNVYYGATEKFGTDATGAELDDWVTMNKELAEMSTPLSRSLSKSIRIAVPTSLYEVGTDAEKIPNNYEDALANEIVMNLRAINDFISDTGEKSIKDAEGNVVQKTIWNEESLKDIEIEGLKRKLTEGLSVKITESASPDTDKKTGEIEVPNETINQIKVQGSEFNKIYEELLREVYAFLEIPRIHCPWAENINGQDIIYLGSINVENTDLKFKGEKSPNAPEGDPGASGKYEVILFSAREVAEAAERDPNDPDASVSVVNFNNPCLLHSPFTVQPSFTIAVQTDMEHNGVACEGAIASVEAKLWGEEIKGNNPTGNMVAYDGAYTFDWYIGTMNTEDEKKNMKELQNIIKGFRDQWKSDEMGHTSFFSKEDILKSSYYNNYKTYCDRLIGLLSGANPRLIIGDGKKSASILWTENIVALPYAPQIETEQHQYLYCTEPQARSLDTYRSPELSVGFPNVVYPISNVPLRLGLRNICDASGNGVRLKDVPIRNNINGEKPQIVFGSDLAKSLGKPYAKEGVDRIYVYNTNTQDYLAVATLSSLFATKDGGNLSLTFDDNAVSHFKEGETYLLYVPFGEYSDDNASAQILGSCGGYAELELKIVPEYLTWHGGGDDRWYNDMSLWKTSTMNDLYGKVSTTTSTGTFSPLYFTNITIQGKDNPLSLIPETYEGTGVGKILSSDLVGTNIRYDMAVNSNDHGKNTYISSYYGNKVNQIYFKPEATLMNQHLLDYENAWVEFEMDNNEKRWFASPLQHIYAGDFYAPKDNGRQETEAFKDITYGANTNSRWAPAFYQKAWNSAIKYATTVDGNSSDTVAAVKSNWSIEYNDVTVEYPIGKGFYLSVEEVPNGGMALVRLPKADAVADYQYEAATKASVLRANEYPKEKSGQLAAYKNTDGILKVKLSDLFGESESDVTGEGSTSKKRHFLVGNPYMTYLDMDVFLTNNGKVLGNKYWTLTDGTVNATVVGTPDVPFEGEYTTGTVAPMQAFFVELAENATVDESSVITFTPDMMSATEIAKGGATTKGATATDPIITITAERGEIKSVATLSTSDRADNGYKADEDAVVLLDSELDAPMVYTVAGSLAAQVNAVKNIHNIGLGLYNDSREEVTITINGLSRLANRLYLYDAHTGKSVKMESDSYSMTIGGDSHGRYYLRDSELGSELDNAISIQSTQRGRVIVSAIRPVKEIKVFSLSGSQVRGFSVNSTQYGFDLPAGIYMIYASDGEREHTEKVIVR